MSENPSRKRLGRGLAALIGDVDMPDTTEAAAQQTSDNSQNETQGKEQSTPPAAEQYIAINAIVPNENNPRRSFSDDELVDLAQSINEHGVVQPILVRTSPQNEGYYELIAGERRWRAAQLAGLENVPVVMRDVDDRTALELAIIENVQRSDLNPVEEALGYKKLIDEHGYLQADLAQIIGKSRSHLTNMMRLLKLPDDVLDKLAMGQLSIGHARCLINANDPSLLAQEIINKGLSVRQAEQLVAEGADTEKKKPRKAKEKDDNTVALERNLGEKLGMQVAINLKKKGGDIRISYKSLDQLDSICRILENS